MKTITLVVLLVSSISFARTVLAQDTAPRLSADFTESPMLEAHSVGTTSVELLWTGPDGEITWEVQRRSSDESVFTALARVSESPYIDSTAVAGEAYIYRILRVSTGEYSNPALATTFSFSDDPMIAGQTIARALHVTELRDAVQKVRTLAALAPASWTHSVAAMSLIRLEDVEELRSALDPALISLGLGSPSYTDPTLTRYVTPVRAAHIRELRLAVKGVQAGGWYSVTHAGYQFNPHTGGSVLITSTIPFEGVTQTLEVYDIGGDVVRTLFHGARAAGTFTNSWDGRNDAGALLPDAAYFYRSRFLRGSSVTVWDQSNDFLPSQDDVYYPECRTSSSSAWVPCETLASYDPWSNRTLEVRYVVAQPARIDVVFGHVNPMHAGCGSPNVCVEAGQFRAAGTYVARWTGVSPQGWHVDTGPYLAVMRRRETFPRNTMILFGGAPSLALTNLQVHPRLYSPGSGSCVAAGDLGCLSIQFDLESFNSLPHSLIVEVLRIGHATPLRTMTLPNQAAGPATVVWNGLSDHGEPVVPGAYSIVIRGSDAAGKEVTAGARLRIIY